MLDAFILGDNAFFGVNHHSQKIGVQKAEIFKDTQKIIDVLIAAKHEGAGGVMLSSHDRTPEIIRAILSENQLQDFNVYPNIPYIMKYVQKVTQIGLMGSVKEMLSQSGLSALIGGGLGVMTKDYVRILKSAVDLEMTGYRGVPTPVIFLHKWISGFSIGTKNV